LHKNEDFESECQDRTHEKTGDYGSAHRTPHVHRTTKRLQN
jgi:hypothetical protein